MTDEYNAADCKSDECGNCSFKRIKNLIEEPSVMALQAIAHDPPRNQDELGKKREMLLKQRKELTAQPITWVTCICGARIALKMAFRCWFCGITFCPACAERHFGEKPLMFDVTTLEEKQS